MIKPQTELRRYYSCCQNRNGWTSQNKNKDEDKSIQLPQRTSYKYVDSLYSSSLFYKQVEKSRT